MIRWVLRHLAWDLLAEEYARGYEDGAACIVRQVEGRLGVERTVVE